MRGSLYPRCCIRPDVRERTSSVPYHLPGKFQDLFQPSNLWNDIGHCLLAPPLKPLFLISKSVGKDIRNLVNSTTTLSIS